MSNEKPLHQKSAQGKIPTCLDHSVEHLACTVAVHIQKNSVFSVVFPSSDSVTRPQCALARCTQPLPLGQHPARTLGRFLASVATSLAGVGSFCGGCTFRGGQQGPEPSHHATRRRPTPPGSPRVPAMLAHARGTVAVARQARNVLPAADGPCHPRSVELAHSTKSQPV